MARHRQRAVRLRRTVVALIMRLLIDVRSILTKPGPDLILPLCSTVMGDGLVLKRERLAISAWGTAENGSSALAPGRDGGVSEMVHGQGCESEEMPALPRSGVKPCKLVESGAATCRDTVMSFAGG